MGIAAGSLGPTRFFKALTSIISFLTLVLTLLFSHGPQRVEGQYDFQRRYFLQYKAGGFDDGCDLPRSSDGAVFEISECGQQNHHPICNGQSIRVPYSWSITMVCKQSQLTYRYFSKCGGHNFWNPALFDNCAALIGEASPGRRDEFSPGENYQDIPPTSFAPSGGVACRRLILPKDERFRFTCRFPGNYQETDDCGTDSRIPSGTVATLSCRPPLHSKSGHSNTFRCDNGKWSGDFSVFYCEGIIQPAKTTYYNPVVVHQKHKPASSPNILLTSLQQPAPAPAPAYVAQTEAPAPVLAPFYPVKSDFPAPIPVTPAPAYGAKTEPPFPAPALPTLSPAYTTKTEAPPPLWANSAPTYAGKTEAPVWPTSAPHNLKADPPAPVPSSIPVNNIKQGTSLSKPTEKSRPSNLVFENKKPVSANAPDNLEGLIDFRTWNKSGDIKTGTPGGGSTYKSATTQAPSVNKYSPPAKEVTCPPLRRRSHGVQIECTFKSKVVVSQTTCEGPVPVGTEARYYCEEHYETTAGNPQAFRICKGDGTWTGSSDGFVCAVQCGRGNTVRSPYIINGEATIKGQWPWHAALFVSVERTAKQPDNWRYICGGTLIGRGAILTAAHCVTHTSTTVVLEKSDVRVDLGKYNLHTVDEFVQSRAVKEIVIHPSFSPFGFDSDIALIILKEPIHIDYHVRPICFPQTQDSGIEELHLSDKSTGTVVGWGRDSSGKTSEVLKVATLPVVSPRECLENVQEAFVTQLQTRSTTFCAGFVNGTNVCNGDSGGGMYFPFKSSGSTRWYLQGIVSVGIPDAKGDCDPTKYSVFTRVGRYSDWIIRQMAELT